MEPNVFVDKNYFLRDKELLKYEWSEDNLIRRNTLVSCGSLIVEIYMDDGSQIDDEVFTLDEKALIVNYSEDVSRQRLYLFRFIAYYDQYPDQVLQISEPFKVGIINPCESPYSILPPSKEI